MAPSISDAEKARAARIAARLPLRPVPAVPGLLLHLATPQSRLSDLLGPGGQTPYWAYLWAGGLALAAHILDHPETVADRDVVDFGAGSGLVGLVAARAGAASVTAIEPDAMARAAIALNAAANNARLRIVPPADWVPEPGSLILAGDVFYAPAVARQSLATLRRAALAGADVLIGDPGRRDLPLNHLTPVTAYPVTDFGSGNTLVAATLYRLGGRSST
ncbi:MAG: class I SAM-dependent methyltransferase [Devosia sp.]